MSIERVEEHLARLYPDLADPERTAVATKLIGAVAPRAKTPEIPLSRSAELLDRGTAGSSGAFGFGGSAPAATVPPAPVLPSQDEVMLITYGDTIIDDLAPEDLAGRELGADDPGEQGAGLKALARLLDGPLAGVFSTVHVLPFFRSSSDGGFSVIDYREIEPRLGTWSDLEAVIRGRELMIDVVCNHGSVQSDWFQAFLRDEAPYRDWYLTADPADADLATVVRPRTHPLLLPVETASGQRHVWATFSHDQVDFDFGNPDVLVEFCSIVGEYLDRGATRIRLDAIAYLWKRLGTSCIHLPETHEVVKLLRTLTSLRPNPPLLITETNVPHEENVAYFGDGDEAQVVYNFTLAPLIVSSVLAERPGLLTDWLEPLDAPPAGCTFLNFIASHDGIGLRPIEDLVSPGDLQVLLERAVETGGAWSDYSTPQGPRPYELNVSLADLLAGPDGAHANRYVLAHALLLAVQGIPAIYVHSMLSTPGDLAAVERTGHRRDINRSRLPRSAVDACLADGWRADVFVRLAHLVRTRRAQPAFAPNAAQAIHRMHDRVVAIERRSDSGQRLLAIHNVSGQSVDVDVPSWRGTRDLLTGGEVAGQVSLGAWQAAWLA